MMNQWVPFNGLGLIHHFLYLQNMMKIWKYDENMEICLQNHGENMEIWWSVYPKKQQQPETILTRLHCCQETARAATKDPSGAEAVAGDVSTLGGTTKKTLELTGGFRK